MKQNLDISGILMLYYIFMQAGIKIGLRDYKIRIPETKSPICEVYFRYDKKDQYDDLFWQLKNKGLPAGLHYWGTIGNNIMYNLAYPDKQIRDGSLKQIKETIDIASKNKLRYVNVHPGNYLLLKLNIDAERFDLLGQEVKPEIAHEVLLENVRILHNYALKRNVLFLIETVPLYDNPKWYDETTRHNPLNSRYIPLKIIILLAEKGFYITNDLGHTVCNTISNDRSFLFNKLREATKILAPQTRLIHFNTTKPPFNGVDTHNCLTAADFAQNVIPSKSQCLEILQIFKNRSDIWIIPEPLENHEENFEILDKMVKETEKSKG